MFNQMKQLYDMQKKAKEIKKQMQAIKIERKSSGDTLSITVNGAQEVEGLTIDTSWLSADKKEKLERELKDLLNDAMEEVQKKSAMQAAELMKGMQGMKIPGF